MARSREGTVVQRHDHPTCPTPNITWGTTLKDEPKRIVTYPPHRCQGRWVAAVDLGLINGKRRRVYAYGATEKEALAAKKRLIAEKDAGRLADDCTLSAWLDHWVKLIAPEKASPTTVANYAGHIRHYITPQLGRIRLSQLRPDDVRKLRAHLEDTPIKRGSKPDAPTKRRSPSTVRAVLVTLDAALRAAERERRISWNPAAAVPKPAAAKAPHPWLTTAQARAVINAADGLEEQARLAVALYAGLRQGEALALLWTDIDLDLGVIDVHKALVKRVGGGHEVKPTPKNDWSVRRVPLSPLVRATVANWRTQANGPYVFGGDTFTSPAADYRRWRAACKRANVPPVPLHGARATTATMLRERGVPLSTIGDILGHRPGSAITGLSYAHSQHAELEQAISQLDS